MLLIINTALKKFDSFLCAVCEFVCLCMPLCVCLLYSVWQYLSDHCRISHHHHNRSPSSGGSTTTASSAGSALLMEGVSQPRSGEYIWVRERVHGRRVKENIPKYISVALKSMFGTGKPLCCCCAAAAAVRLLCCAAAVRLLCCAAAVRLLCGCCAAAVLWLCCVLYCVL